MWIASLKAFVLNEQKVRKRRTRGRLLELVHSRSFQNAEPIQLVFPNTEGHLGGAEMCVSDMMNFSYRGWWQLLGNSQSLPHNLPHLLFYQSVLLDFAASSPQLNEQCGPWSGTWFSTNLLEPQGAWLHNSKNRMQSQPKLSLAPSHGQFMLKQTREVSSRCLSSRCIMNMQCMLDLSKHLGKEINFAMLTLSLQQCSVLTFASTRICGCRRCNSRQGGFG